MSDETMTSPTTTSTPTASTPGSAGAGGRRHRRTRWVAPILVALVVAVAGGWLALRWLQPHPYSGTVLQAPTAAPSMEGLVDTTGDPVDLADYRGDLLLLYFGYTNCPDVCPTTLSQVDQALDRLGDDAQRVHVLMVSIDPERDELGMLGDYVTSFDPTFVAATGSLVDVERVASTYGVYFLADEASSDGSYDVDHSATLMGIDTEGRLRIVWPALLDVDELAADIHELL
jgi:protein SCO1/2